MWILFVFLPCILCVQITETTTISQRVNKLNDPQVIMMLQLGGVRISDTLVTIMGTAISTNVVLSAFSDAELIEKINNSKKNCK
jgi:hypothetical protein